MDCSPPGSSVHGIFQARVLEWGAICWSLTNELKFTSVILSWDYGVVCVLNTKQDSKIVEGSFWEHIDVYFFRDFNKISNDFCGMLDRLMLLISIPLMKNPWMVSHGFGTVWKGRGEGRYFPALNPPGMTTAATPAALEGRSERIWSPCWNSPMTPHLRNIACDCTYFIWV